MKIFRSIGFALAMACGALLGAVSMAVEPLLRYVSAGCDALSCGIAKLDRELAQKFAEPMQKATGVGCGLNRESNGYRQSSAADIGAEERTALAV